MFDDQKIAESTVEHVEESRQAARTSQRLSCRVLLAEDALDSQRLLCLFLKKAGAQVIVVGNGQTAYEKAMAAFRAEAPFDVILMDMQMPVLDGHEATRRLRDGGYTGPIVALPAHALPEEREKCLTSGCDEFCSKPISRERLLEIVARYSANNSDSTGKCLTANPVHSCTLGDVASNSDPSLSSNNESV